MKHLCIALAIALTAAFSASAKTFDWPIGSPAAKAETFTAYHGETVRFNLRFGGAMTNLAPVCIYYQTNGMGRAEWFGPVPGTVFHPTNDCGAASYRFFILCNDPDGRDYTANGSLRLLDSPGFEPSAVQLPAQTLDFAKIEVLNPPWGEGPGNYAAVSNAAISARDKADLAVYRKVGVGETWTLVGDGGATTNSATGVFGDVSPDRWTFYIDGQVVAASYSATSYDYEVEWSGTPSIGTGGTAVRRCGFQPTADRLATTNGMVTAEIVTNIVLDVAPAPGDYAAVSNKAMHAVQPSDIEGLASLADAATATNAEQSAALASQASQLSQQSQSLSTLGSQVNAIGAHLNAEDARFVATNYNSATHLPEAYVEVKVTENGVSSWLSVWREMTRWNWFLGIYTNDFAALSAALATKGEREYAFYDGVTGEPAPDGFFWIAQPRVAVAAGMSYQRYVDTGGAVWVLESNGMVADVNGTTNGYFRISDDEGNVQFEIVKGSSHTVAAAPGAVSHATVMGVTHWYTTYAVTNATSAPVAMFCRDIGSPEWYAETDGDCPCNVLWANPESGVYVCEWWAKGTEPRMFMKAEYGQGTESRIVQSAPVEMQYIVINGVKYTLGTATISGNTVLTLSPAAP